MTDRAINRRLTPGRRAWLERLLKGPARRPHNRVGFECNQLGWTEWQYVERETREPISIRAARMKFGPMWRQGIEMTLLEQLTPEGREVLEKAAEREAA